MSRTRAGRYFLGPLILILVVLGYIGLVAATAWLLLNVGWFYFFWSYGLSAVASYMLTDFTEHHLFDRICKTFSIKFKTLRAVAFIELIFTTAILGSLLNFAFQTSLENDISLVLLIGYPLLIVLGWVYYSRVYARRDD